jgi:hypothetical protein
MSTTQPVPAEDLMKDSSIPKESKVSLSFYEV